MEKRLGIKNFFNFLCLTAFCSTLCQVQVSSAKDNVKSKPNTLVLDPIVVSDIFETAQNDQRARTDEEDGSDQCFIQGPQGFRQSLRMYLSSPSNENLTVPVGSIVDGMNEFGDSYFQYSGRDLDRFSNGNELDSDVTRNSKSNSLLSRADLNNETSTNNNANTNTTTTTTNSTDSDSNAISAVNLYPCWLDRDLARRGQSFARQYFSQINNAHILSLMLLIVNEQVRRVLAFTMKSNNPERARKRYLATMLQVKLWYDEDLSSPHLVKSLLKVRNIHRTVGYRLDTEMPDLTQQQITTPATTSTTESLDTVTVTSSDNNNNNNNNENQTDNGSNSNNSSGNDNDNSSEPTAEPPFKPNKWMWEALRKDLNESHLNQTRGNVTSGRKFGKYAYNQFLMSLTQWSFMAIPVLYPHKFVAMQEVTDEDLQGFAHLWAVISYALGMKEEYIICKNRDLESCRAYCKELLDKHFIPFLFNLDDEAEILLESLLKLATYITPQVTEESILLQLLEDFIGIDCPNLRKYAGWPTHFVRQLYQHKQNTARPFGFFSQFINLLFRGQIQVASSQVYGFDGTNPEDVAEKAYYFK